MIRMIRDTHDPNWSADKKAFMEKFGKVGGCDMKVQTWHCDEHGDFHVYIIDGEVPEKIECPMCRKAELAKKDNEAVYAQMCLPYSNLDPKEWKLSTMTWITRVDQDLTAKAQASNFLEDDHIFMIMHGNTGSGKTTLASGMVADYCRQGRQGLIITARLLDYRVQGSWRTSRGAEGILKDMVSVELLVIDEFQTNLKDYVVAFLDELLKLRYRLKKKTIIVTNAEPNTLANVFDRTLASRLFSNKSVSVSFKDGDRRKEDFSDK